MGNKASIKELKERLPLMRLFRAEHFLAHVGIHPKALEYYDYQNAHRSDDKHEIWQQFPKMYDTGQGPPSTDNIKHLIAGYPSAREYFIDQLAQHIAAALRRNPLRHVLYRTTDFKTHDMRHLFANECFEVEEKNPQWGFRGLGRYLTSAYEELFTWELEACRLTMEKYNVFPVVVFPFVRLSNELKPALKKVSELGIMPKGIGIMIELPGNVMEVKELTHILYAYTIYHSSAPLFLLGLSDLVQAFCRWSRDDEIVDPNSLAGEFYAGVTDIANPTLFDLLQIFLDYAYAARVPCGLHIGSLDHIIEKNQEFALYLLNRLEYLVEDHVIWT